MVVVVVVVVVVRGDEENKLAGNLGASRQEILGDKEISRAYRSADMLGSRRAEPMTWRRGSRAGGPLQACGKDVCDQLADSTWQQEPASTSGDCVVCDLDLPLHQSQLDLYPDRIIHTRIPPLTSRQWTSVPLESHQHHHTAKRLPAPQHPRRPPFRSSIYRHFLLLLCSFAVGVFAMGTRPPRGYQRTRSDS